MAIGNGARTVEGELIGMIDKEKLRKGFECCTYLSGEWCRVCPYQDENDGLPVSQPICTAALARDALNFLKEQEQESVEPTIDQLSFCCENIDYSCGECGTMVGSYDNLLKRWNLQFKYCCECGKKVKWDD